MDNKTGENNHLASLDSLRGLCAIAVVLFHFPVPGELTNNPLVRNSWMFVDFFFVLSGYVIAAAYAEKIQSKQVSVGLFLWLRMGRIYPLHIAVILAMVTLELALANFEMLRVTSRQAFTGDRTLEALLANLLCLHSFGLFDNLTWNGPSWSIAAEMWAYVLFSLVFRFAGDAAGILLNCLGGLALIFLWTMSPNGLDTTFEFGFIRCVFGFAVGVATYRGTQYAITQNSTFLKLVSLPLSLSFVIWSGTGPLTLLAPFTFALSIHAFSKHDNWISRLVEMPLFAYLGLTSYSIYMWHAFVQARLGDIIALFGEHFDISSVPRNANDTVKFLFAAPQPMLNLLVGIMLFLVIMTAHFSYIWIESPFRSWSRTIARSKSALPLTRRVDLSR